MAGMGPIPLMRDNDIRQPGGGAGEAHFNSSQRHRSLKPQESPGPSDDVPMPPDDWDLVARARARDTGAFRELVERHRTRAYGLSLRMLRSPADAEEVTQDAFVRAWLALPQFRGESRFSTWLHRIVARRALDRAEVLKRRRDREVGVEAMEHLAEERVETSGAALAMERMVAGLSDMQRAVVTLFYYEGRSVEQVAGVLGLPTGTVKTHLSRARSALRNSWTRDARAREPGA